MAASSHQGTLIPGGESAGRPAGHSMAARTTPTLTRTSVSAQTRDVPVVDEASLPARARRSAAVRPAALMIGWRSPTSPPHQIEQRVWDPRARWPGCGSHVSCFISHRISDPVEGRDGFGLTVQPDAGTHHGPKVPEPCNGP